MFARKLVSKMNVEMDEKIGIQVSNDGGLDGFGYITSDDFRTARVAIQAKRWEGNVPSPEIDKFRGQWINIMLSLEYLSQHQNFQKLL